METNYNNIKPGIGAGIIIPDVSADKSRHEIARVICNKTVNTDIGGEFSISEHLPDIRKLIKVDVIPSVPVKFISGSALQLSGGVDYLAVYVGADGEIYGETFSSEYSLNLPFDSIASGNEMVASAVVYPDSAVSRVGGARRINIKCRLAGRATVLSTDSVDGGTGACYDDHVQRLIKNNPYCTQLVGVKDDIEFTDEVDTSDDGVKYISTDCRIFIESVESGDGYADCRGTALLKHLMCREGGELYSITTKIPFSEAIEIDKLKAGSSVCVSGRCAEVGADTQNIDEIGDGKLRLVIKVCLEATAFNQGLIEYVKDAYSTREKCSVESESCKLPVLLACKNGNMTFGGCEELSKMGIGSDRIGIIDISGSAKCEDVAWDGNKYVASGKCRFGVIYYIQDISDMAWAECELPFKYEFEGAAGNISRYNCAVSVIDLRARCDGEKMQFDCELAVACSVVGECEIEMVSSLRTEGEGNKRKHGFTVCYPDVSDSLWSVAKRYRACVNDTAKGNGIECAADPDEIRLPESIKYMIV